MAGAIADETIMRLTLQYDQFIKGMQESRAALKQFQDDGKSSGSGMASGLIKQFGQIKQFAGLTGDATGGVAEKMSTVSSKLQEMVKAGQGGSKQAEILSKMFGRLKGEASGVGGGLSGIVQSLGRSIPGFSQISNVLGQVSSAFPKLAAAAGPAAVAVMAVAAAYKFIIIPGMEFNAMLEQQNIAFTAMLKSGDKATMMLNDLKKLSLTTPIGLGESSASAKQMLAYGFAQNEIIDNMKLMKTVASAVNVSLSDITYVYGTLRAQGRAYTRDLMQFAMRGIPIYEYLSKTMGISVAEIKKATEDGRIGFVEVEAAMKAMTGEGGKFNGMLEASMKTTQGLKTQIKNTWEMFTGRAAEGSSAAFKLLLKYTLMVVKQFQALGPSFDFLFTMISVVIASLVAALLLVVSVLMAIDQFIQNVVQDIIMIVKWMAAWVDKALGVSKFFKAMGDGASNFGTWLLDSIPILTTILNTAGKIGDAIKKWWDRDTGSGGGRDTVNAEFGKNLERSSDRYMELVSRFSRYNVTDLPASQIAEFAQHYDLSVETVLKAMANFKSMTQKQYDDILRNTQNFIHVNRNYWEVYRGDIDDVAKDMALNMNAMASGSTVKDALFAVEDTLKSVSGFTSTLDMAKILGLDSDETKDGVKKSAQSIADTLYEQIEIMRNMVVYKSGEGKTFFDGLVAMWQKYNQMVEKEGGGGSGKTEKALNDILGQYIEFRSEWATTETQFNSSLVEAINARIGGDADIRKNTTMYDRQIAVINKKYNDMYTELETTAEEYNFSPLSAGPVIEEMRRIELMALQLNTRLKTIQDRSELTTSGQESVALLKEQYNIQLELNRLKALGDKLSIEDQKTLIKSQADIAKMMKEGDQGAYDRLTNQLMTEGTVGGMIQGTQLSAVKGTDIGNLIAGANPLVGALTAFAEMIVSIESVSKVLNFFGTIMEGMKVMLDGVTGTLKSTTAETEKGVATIKGQSVQVGGMLTRALEPAVKLLTKLGEILGALLVPYIELVTDYLNVFIQPLVFVAELFKRFIVAIGPLIKLILIIQNPFLILGVLLKDFITILGSLVSTESDHQKDLEDLYDKELATLQNLYEVGALSGAQYEERLAELKRRYGKTTEVDKDNPIVAALSAFFDVFDVLSKSLADLMVALKPAMDAIAGPLVSTLVAILTILGSVVTGVAQMLTGVTNMITGLLTWNWDLVKEGFRSVINGALTLILGPIYAGINWILDIIDNIWQYGVDNIGHISVPQWAEGTGNLPYDMIAQVHKGEGIIPSNFMDAIRAGDLSLSGAGGSSGGALNVYITVEGSVTTERDLCKTIYDGISVLKRKGSL